MVKNLWRYNQKYNILLSKVKIRIYNMICIHFELKSKNLKL